MASDKVNYPEVGSIAQAIKYQIRTGGFWDGLTGSSKESLDQIATAIARTVSGDGVHWDAIIGYAHAAKPSTDDPNAVPPPMPPSKRAGHLFDPAPDLESDVRRIAQKIPQRDRDA